MCVTNIRFSFQRNSKHFQYFILYVVCLDVLLLLEIEYHFNTSNDRSSYPQGFLKIGFPKMYVKYLKTRSAEEIKF